jgi:hypothetical protein
METTIGLKPGTGLSIDYRDGKIEIERKSLKFRIGSKRFRPAGQHSWRAEEVGGGDQRVDS